jgi:hypothetical protein
MTQRSSGPLRGYDRIDLTLRTRADDLVRGQWRWLVQLDGYGAGVCVHSEIRASGIEGTEENATRAAMLAREEQWELLR